MHSITDRRTDGRTDGQQAAANSRSYCVAVRSANKNQVVSVNTATATQPDV